MKSHFFRLVVLFAFLTGTLVAVPSIPVHAGVPLIVTNTNDSGPGSLRDTITAAVDGDQIVFAGGVTGTITLSYQIIITYSITITGPGSGVLSISGGDAAQIFRINDVNVSISGLTLTHGRVLDGYGGAIDNSCSSTLMMDQVVISHNSALNSTGSGGYGGAIMNCGSLIISNSTLSYNTATNQGGALYNYSNAGLQMSNVIVDHNQAITESGGGLFIRGPSSAEPPLTVLLDRVSITNNSAATDEGGGIWSEDSITIMNSLIGNNSAYNYGGLRFTDATYPAAIYITNTTITGNTSTDGAGGLHISFGQSSSEAALNNLTIVNNQNTNGTMGGGGISIGSTGVTGVQNTIIAGNTSYGPTPNDCYGWINSQDYNLIQTTTGCTISGSSTHNIYGVSPQLAALADNGGLTQTMALLAGSPAIDAGNPLTPGPGTNACESLDQRGIARPRGALCDIGAYELEQTILVDDDDNNPDVRSSYTDTLNALGKKYYVWDTNNSDTEPDAATLANYNFVIWFTGAESGDAGGAYAGPGSAGEAALSAYLNGGGKFLISSQDYNYDRGLTGLMTDYLGVSAVADEVDQTIVTGTGSVFGGLGPYTLTYPFINYSDLILPDATAEVAFSGDHGNAAVDKNSGTYCTAYLGFPFETIASQVGRQQVMNAFFDWCISPILSVSKSGSGSGTVTSDPVGINCGPTCSFSFAASSTVTLIATPTDNYNRFIGWSGTGISCPGTGTCKLSMTEARTVTAEFKKTTFTDVPYDYSVTYGGVIYPLHSHIQALYDAGYTKGCSTDPLSYCPNNTLTRVEAAVFMLRGMIGTSYAPPTDPSGYVFTDDWSSPTVGWGQPWAEGMWDEGLTAGCSTDPLLFCPATIFTRAEASVFGLRIENGASYTPPAATHIFADDWLSPTINWAEPWAEQAYLHGLLPACGESGGKPLFCPGDLVTRAWAAYLVVEAKDLPLTP